MKNLILRNGKCRGSTTVSRVDGFVSEARYTIAFDADVVGGPVGDAQASFEITTMSKRITEAEAAPAKGASKIDSGREPARKGE